MAVTDRDRAEWRHVARRGILLVPFLSLLTLCGEATLADLDDVGPTLAPCPATPNCVSSNAIDDRHRTNPYTLAAPASQAWQALRAVVAALPRTRIVVDTGVYLHAECESAWFGFVDDLEFALRPGQGIIAVRSASRVGYFDLGVNGRRIERLRSDLVARGVVRN